MTTCADLLGTELASTTVSIPDAPFAVLTVRGPDAADFLQRLCTQDVAALAEGAALPAAFLTAKGKLESLVWVGRDADGFVIEAQSHERDKVAALLERYHFAEKLAVAVPADWTCAMVLGPDPNFAGEPPRGSHGGLSREGDGVSFAGACRGLGWTRWHGPAESAPAAACRAAGIDAWEVRRVAAGLPWMGLDVDGATLAMEAGIDDHISSTKGCYTGQEIVARIQTYGHVNRRLCRLRIDGTGAVAPGSAVMDDEGIPIGRVLSVFPVPGAGARLGLGFLPRELAAEGATHRLADGAAVHVVP